jgi:enolase-phosphatase E1
MSLIRHIVTDIEGTTTSMSFVKVTLYDHARRALPAFIEAHAADPEVRAALGEARDLLASPQLDDGAVVQALLRWIDEDRKARPLKALQGLLWAEGYRQGAYRAHVYPDVLPALRGWRAMGLRLSVFSSGSILAQKLLYAHTEAGDLTPLFDKYFDTTTGPKNDPASYTAIAEALGAAPREVLFLSDASAELDAAERAGLWRIGLAREGATVEGAHPVARSFDEIVIDENRVEVRSR